MKGMRTLVIERHPYGRLVDAEKLCRYALADQEVTFLSFGEMKGTRATMVSSLPPNVQWLRVPYRGGVLARYISFVKACIREARQHHLVYLYYFPGCSVVRVLSRNVRTVLDIRTAAIASSDFVRWSFDLLLRLEASAFRHVTVVSEGVRDRLGLTGAHVVPVGGELLRGGKKSFQRLHLLYIGTLDASRRLVDTIEGLALFRTKCGGRIEVRYTMVGEGSERANLELRTRALGLEDCVRFVGYVPHDETTSYFEEANVGISYVPITPYYDDQPPTKTYEYLLAGLPVIATATAANRAVVNRGNGVLIGDSAADVCRGLSEFVRHRTEFDSDATRSSIKGYAWPEIMRDNVRPFIEGVRNGERRAHQAHT